MWHHSTYRKAGLSPAFSYHPKIQGNAYSDSGFPILSCGAHVGISARRTRIHLRAVFDREVSGKGSGTHTVILRAEEVAGNMLYAGFRQRPCD